MRRLLIPLFAAVLLLSAGCGASAPAASASPPPAETDAEAENEDGAYLMTLEIPGLPDDAELADEVHGENDSYRIEWLYDGAVQIVSARVPCIDSDENAVAAQVKSLADTDVSELDAVNDEKLSQKFSYPVWRITYATGSNEDTRENVDVYIQTDAMDYWFHTATPADFYEDYDASIEDWINSLALS